MPSESEAENHRQHQMHHRLTEQPEGLSKKTQLIKKIQVFLYKIALPQLDQLIFLNPDDPKDLVVHNKVQVKNVHVLGGIGVDLKAFPYSARHPKNNVNFLEKLVMLSYYWGNIKKIGFDTDYYTAVHSNFDLPYDLYRPELQNPRTQIEIMQKDGTLTELSELSSLVKSLTGTTHGDNRFYFPRDILSPETLFKAEQEDFISYIKNDHFLGKERL